MWGWNVPSLPRPPIRLTSELVIGSVQVSGIGQTLLATLAPHGPRRPPPVPSRLGRGRGRRVAKIGRSHGAPWWRSALHWLGAGRVRARAESLGTWRGSRAHRGDPGAGAGGRLGH